MRVGFGARYGCDAQLLLGDDLGESEGRSGRQTGAGDGGCEGPSDEGDGEREEGGSGGWWFYHIPTVGVGSTARPSVSL